MKKRKDKLLFTGGTLALVLSMVVFGFSMSASPSGVSANNGILYASDVCVFVDRADGSTDVIEGCDGSNPNFFTPDGQDAVMDFVGTGFNGGAFDTIAIGNVTNGATAQYDWYIDAGLTNGSGTFTKIDIGNWSIERTFTATADEKGVNGTSILNGSTTGSVFFANNSFADTTLNTNDQITIRWNISIS